MRYIGKPVKRIIEDPPLITGKAQFVYDIQLPGILYAYFVRSQYPHAKIKSINCPEGCYTAKDLPFPVMGFAKDEIVYEGQPLAVVVAEDEYTARDLAEKVEVEYEPLPHILDPWKAMEENAPRARSDLPTNIGAKDTVIAGDVDSAFKRAYKIIKGELVNQRVIPSAMEPRGVTAYYDGRRVTIWSSTQVPYDIKKTLFKYLAPLGVYDVRVIQPFVGGAFGSKGFVYPEEVIVAYLSVLLRRPIKWFNTRIDDMRSTNHGRDMRFKFEAAFDREGHLLGIRGDIVIDLGGPIGELGSYEGGFGMAATAARLQTGRYKISNLKINAYGVFTNKTILSAYRGAGRPEATYFIERIITLGARALGIDQFEIRERNIIPEVHHYVTPTGMYYDSGKYAEILKIAKPHYQSLIDERNKMRSKGILAGVGVTISTEIAVFGPYSTAKVKVLPTGKIQVITGLTPHGQGDATALAQVAAEVFDIEVNNVDVLWGDTDLIAEGDYTAGSRSVTVGGAAVQTAAMRLKERLIQVVAEGLKVRPEEIEYKDGKFTVSKTGKSISLAEASSMALNMGILPEEGYSFPFKQYTSPYGVHMALVTVDPELGKVSILRYVAIDDVGVVVNPLLAEGQVHGGVLQGLGQALYEEAIYSSDGYLLTSNLSDYPVPTAVESIKVEWKNVELSKSETPLGSKGIGELPTISSTPTIVAAVEDAIDKDIYEMPLTPEKILKLLGKL